MKFQIYYKDNLLKYHNFSLNTHEEDYLQSYLNQINQYKVISIFESSPVFSLYQPPLASAPGMRSLQMRIDRKFARLKLPATATISLTKSCQCECAHCSAVYYNHSIKPNLPTHNLVEAVKQTVDLGVTTLILLGGEPLLRKDIFKVIESVDKKKSTIILFTNGEYLTRENCLKLKDVGLMGAFVSFDSWIESEHDYLRDRKDLFKKAIEGIENMNSTGLISGVSSYISPQRLAENGFEQIVDFTIKIGARELTLFDAIPSGRWLKDESHILRPEDHRQIKELVRLYRNKPDTPGLSVQSTMTSGECGSAFCFAANTQFYLTAAGEMCPCDFTPLTAGTFPQESIENLWYKMISTEPYNKRAKACRMQNADFRKKYILPIPENGPFPYPLENLIHK